MSVSIQAPASESRPSFSQESIPIPVRPCWIVRSRFIFFLTELPAFAAVLAYGAWRWTDAGASPAAPALGGMLALLTCVLCASAARVDRLLIGAATERFLGHSFMSLGAGLLVLAVVFRLLPQWSPGDFQVLGIAIGSMLLPWAARPLLPRLIERRALARMWVILGKNDVARRLSEELEKNLPWSLAVAGYRPEEEILVDGARLRAWSSSGRLTRIVMADPACHSDHGLASVLVDCKLQGVRIEEAIDSYERLHRKVWLSALRPEWLILCDGFRPTRLYLSLKRVVDFVAALALLAATLPLIGVIVLAVRRTSPGPAFFRQERVGLNGKTFVLFKFRSMRQDAEEATGPVWAREDDDRVTPIGRWLRKTRLDEIPQAWNVLRGEMSFIGPRPERPHFVTMLEDRFSYYGLRHHVRPGITGWAQVMYPYGASVADAYEKLQYDLYYAKHLSFGLDAQVLLKTIKVVLLGRGR